MKHWVLLSLFSLLPLGQPTLNKEKAKKSKSVVSDWIKWWSSMFDTCCSSTNKCPIEVARKQLILRFAKTRTFWMIVIDRVITIKIFSIDELVALKKWSVINLRSIDINYSFETSQLSDMRSPYLLLQPAIAGVVLHSAN